MGSDAEAVLDPELKVRGIENLRVVDASAIARHGIGAYQCCVIMMAEKASDIIAKTKEKVT